MKKVEAIIKHHQLDAVKIDLLAYGVSGMTISEAQGFGRQKGHTELSSLSEYVADFHPKLRIEILCEDDQAEKIADVILKAAHTGKIGDGKIVIYDVGKVIRIRTGETGVDAI